MTLSHPAPESAPVLALAGALRAALVRRVVRARPREACGLLLGRVRGPRHEVAHLLELDNQAESPRTSFRMDALDVARALAFARRRRLILLGSWHSHPEGPAWLSAADRAGVLGAGSLLLCAPFPGAGWELLAYRRVRDGFAPERLDPEEGPIFEVSRVREAGSIKSSRAEVDAS